MATVDSISLLPANGSMIGPINLDAVIDENHIWSNQVTVEPVEAGADRASNIIEMPYRLRITATIADIPRRTVLSRSLAAFQFLTAGTSKLPAAGELNQKYTEYQNFGNSKNARAIAGNVASAISTAQGLFSEGTFSAYEKSIVALARMLQLRATREPFDYISPLGPRPDLVFEALEVPVDTTEDFLFRASLIEFVEVGLTRRDSLAAAQSDLSGDAEDVGTRTTKPITQAKQLRTPPKQIGATG